MAFNSAAGREGFAPGLRRETPLDSTHAWISGALHLEHYKREAGDRGDLAGGESPPLTWKEIFQKAEEGFVVEQHAESLNALDVRKNTWTPFAPKPLSRAFFFSKTSPFRNGG